jgi:hypothetical protein
MLTIVLLICSLKTPPSSCNEDRAVDVIIAGRAGAPQLCFSTGMAVFSANASLSDPSVYPKIICKRA